MSKRIRGQQVRRRTFLRQWREFRGMTLEQAGEMLDMSAAQLSRIETAISPYTQDFLEIAAEVYRADVLSLLSQNPEGPEGIWPIWERARPREREMIVDIAKTVVKSGG